MKLYEIDQAIEAALEGALDPETGEVINDDLMAAYEQLQMDRTQKIENIVCFIKDLDADAKAIREEEKALQSRRKACENRAASLKAYLQWALAGEKFQSARGSVSYRRSSSVQVDENRLFEIPDDYLRYKDPEVDKKRVSEALKAGEQVPGCELVDTISMIIK